MMRSTAMEGSPEAARADSVDRVAQDDWRVTVSLHGEEHVGRLRQALHESGVVDEARERLGDRVVVGGGDELGVVFLYADTRDGAHEAERVVKEILAAHGLEADFSVHRWHPVEERWEDDDVPLPTTEAERAAEHERLEEDEIAESERLGGALWEVRIELESHRDASALAERLEADSYSVIRRWKYLLVGADSEDQANEIVERLRGELPPGATMHVEPSGTLVWATMGTSPFAVLGGLGS
jgi:hypothetical protein